MAKSIDAYRRAGQRAVESQLQYQQADGGFIWEGFPRDAYHKQTYSWLMAGRFAQAHKLLDWVKATTLEPDGQLKDYRGDVYKLSWLFQGAHRLGRFDVSYPVMSFLASCQRACGGLGHFAADGVLRSLATGWTGISALYIGRTDVAEGAARWCIRLLEDQPDDARFYYQTTPDGRLVTDQDDPKGQFIDTTKPKQPYWEVGLPMMLMCRMHQATGEESYLDYARRFFELALRCYEDNYTYVGSGKSALAAAIYYSITDDGLARDMAYRFADTLLETQHPNGGWRDETEPDNLLIYIDHGAEFNVWLQEISALLESKL